jgi:glucokinase
MADSSNPSFQKPLYAGVDVGGTNIKVGVVDDNGVVVDHCKFPTPKNSSDGGFDGAVELMDRLLQKNGFDQDDVAAVGLGTPGPLDLKNGILTTPVNMPGWRDVPVRQMLADATGKPVTYSNDAGAAAFGEYWVGGGRDYESMVLLTLGTGVGGGIIYNGMSIDGAQGLGSEVGHMIIDNSDEARMCNCGIAGHLEAYTSATGVVNRTTELLPNYPDSKLMDLIGETSALSALMVSNAADAGDELAIRIVDETADYLARGIAILAHVINPEAFVLGGAMNFGGTKSKMGRRFLNETVAKARRLVFPDAAKHLTVDFAKLEGDAGFIGAAGLARESHRKA